MKVNKRGVKSLRNWRVLFAISGALLSMSAAHSQNIASLQNLDFENTTDFAGWTTKAFTVDSVNGIPGLQPGANPKHSPVTFADLNLTEVAASASTSAVIRGTAVPDNHNAGLSVPSWGNAVARIHSGSGGSPSGTGGTSNRASGISQTFSVTAADVGKHIRFATAPVLGEPNTPHPDHRQAYFFVSVTNKTKGTTLYTAFNFAGESGVNWQSVSGWKFTDWQLVDVELEAAKVDAGDEITIEVIAAGCADGGHAGYVYLDVPKGLEVVASADKTIYQLHTNPDGSTNVVYTYTYSNTGSTAVDNVTVRPTIPALSSGASGAGSTTFVSVDPNGGSCTNVPAVGANSSTMACNFGTLSPGQSKTFTMTVQVPPGVSADKVINGSYPISGTGANTIDGSVVRSDLVADMHPDTSKLPPGGGAVGVPYPADASFSCGNQGSTAATNATCSVTDLPVGVTAGQCTIAPPLPGNNWNQNSLVPAGSTVTCPVSGIPTATPSSPPKVITGADNDGDPTNNESALNPLPDVRVDLGGLPITATVGVPYSGSFTCQNIGTADAIQGTACKVDNLPSGLNLGACSIGPGSTPWVAGDVIPVNQTVTCQVSGTPANNKGQHSVDGSATTTDDANPGNDTARTEITVEGVPHVVIDLGGIPPTGTVNVPYNGSFTCRNDGSADASNASCTIANLPSGVMQGACTISSAGSAWSSPSNIPEGEIVTCVVSGTPDALGETTVTGAATDNQVTADVNIGTAPAPTPVPTLSQWGSIAMTMLLAALYLINVRRNRRNYK
ncbi:IPTL-CTERM sorting domain-containing protein [Comamonas sp.]|uniref:IPTL-CTERM sorting domain-containing protein n=1 Tax=Comamonas sp. TaxID=34028 RepID=UPI0028A93A4B|nr:IPTL-CTERM sorting domain-containing protein [Comamonas sp.]